MSTVLIALGSNINPEENLKATEALLRKHWPDIRFSSVYQSAAMEHVDQPAFLNAVATFESDESPSAIFTELQVIEQQLKKNPPFRFGPRTIDLDLLLYGDESMDSADLTIPHPKMHERRFVLEPLCELIDPKAEHPVLQKSWKELSGSTKDQECRKIALSL